MSTPSVSVCMIVKDEAKWIGTAIASARALASEIIVVDTGSTDDTPRIARELGARVFDFGWIDDFSAARNFSLAQATSDWILVLDADEILDDAGRQAMADWLRAPTLPWASLVQTTYSFEPQLIMWKPNRLAQPEAANFPGYIESRLTRLFRRDAGIRFVHRVHEEAASPDGPRLPVAALDVRIHHYGQVRADRKEKKQMLYYRIGKRKFAEHPEDAKAAYEFAVASWEAGQIDEARAAFEKAVALFPTHISSLVALATMYARQPDADRAMELFRRALALQPRHIGALLGLADLLIAVGQAVEAGILLERAHDLDAEHPEVLKKLGILYCEAGMRTLGLSFLQKAARLIPGDLPLQLSRGRALLANGREAEAGQVFAHAMTLHLEPHRVRERVEAIYLEMAKQSPWHAAAAAETNEVAQ